jgi:hypothetical protein
LSGRIDTQAVETGAPVMPAIIGRLRATRPARGKRKSARSPRYAADVPNTWDESFDTWSGEDALADISRDRLLKLARELARQRDAERAAAQAEIAELKQALRERAQLVAERERALDDRERRLEQREQAGADNARGQLRRVGRRPRRDDAERAQELEAQARELAQRAAAVTALERELARLQVDLEREAAAAPRRRRLGRGAPPEPPVDPIVAARERELASQLAAVRAREREVSRALAEREAEVAARTRALDEREEALRAQAGALDERASELVARAAAVDEHRVERAVAAGGAAATAASPNEPAERERVLESGTAQRDAEAAGTKAAAGEEHARTTRAADQDARALELERRAAELERREQGLAALEAARLAPRAGAPETEQEPELARRERTIAARERELALVRQGLDAERNALLAREREHRRREAEEGRRTFAPPLAPLSFSEGFAAFAAGRMRRSTGN